LNAERITVDGTDLLRFAEQAIEFQFEHVDASVAAIYNRDQRPARAHQDDAAMAGAWSLDDRFHETGIDEASRDGTGSLLVDSSFEKS
jgi:hypothetical protein